MLAAPAATSPWWTSDSERKGETAYADNDLWSDENDDYPLELGRLLIVRHLKEKSVDKKSEDKLRTSEDNYGKKRWQL